MNTSSLFTLIFALSYWTCPMSARKLDRLKRELYNAHDNVELLTRDNFHKTIEGSPRAWIVEFYASWCGDCQRFLPVWQKFALDVYPWKDLVRVAVLECSDEYNTEVCRDLEIVRYPTLRYFHENYHFNGTNSGAEIKETDETVPDLRRYLLDQIDQEIAEGRGDIYPNLQPFVFNSSERIVPDGSNGTEYVFLILDDNENSYVGREVALDLHKTPNVSIRYGNAHDSGFPVHKLPAVVTFDNEGKVAILPTKEQVATREGIKAVIRDYLSTRNVTVIEDAPAQRDASDSSESQKLDLEQDVGRSKLREHVKKMGDVVFQMDLEAALRYALKQEIGAAKSIDGERLQSLKDFVAVVKKYFPLGLDKDAFLKDLDAIIDSNGTQNVDGARIADLVRSYETRPDSRLFATPAQGYLACQGSTKRHRGYPCALWKLFHYLTVNAATYNHNNRRAKPLEILGPMHGYVKHFFGCRDCSEHFQQMALRRNLSTDVHSPDGAVMWLWAAHNEVNDRLAGDRTEDPEYPKAQFPNEVRCPRCRDSEGNWDEREVLRYLKSVYGKYNVRYIGANTAALFQGLA